MSRIYFTAEVPDYEERGAPVGYFESTRAECWDGGTEWDGRNRVDVNTRSPFTSQSLWRSAGGRWVLEHDARRYNDGGVVYTLVDGDRAREWLLFNRHDDVVATHFGEVAEERGPGRPEIGAPIGVRLPAELRAYVRQQALRWDVAEAEAIRRMIATHQDTHAGITQED